MNYFYAPGILDGDFSLDEENVKHCVKVLRKREGDHIHLMDGQGKSYKALITFIDKRNCEFEVVDTTEHNSYRNYYLHVLIAPTKNTARLEWFIEKATEIGVDEITPILCENSERNKLKLDRLERILIGAAKQSFSFYLPKLNDAIALKDVDSSVFETQSIVGWCEGNPEHISKVYKTREDVNCIIGPEGDFTLEEIDFLKSKKVNVVSLGDSRLRTETAGIEFVSNIKLLNAL